MNIVRRCLTAMAPVFVVAALAVLGGATPAGASTVNPAVVADMPGVQTTWFYPEVRGWVMPNANCLHGENTYITNAQVTSRWTTAECRVPDPNHAEFYRIYDGTIGPDSWFMSIGDTSGFVEVQARESLDGSGYNVWFGYPETDHSQVQISVTPPRATIISGFEPVSDYIKTSPDFALAQMLKLGRAYATQLKLDEQTYNVEGDQHPFTTNAAGSSAGATGDLGVQTGINNKNLGDILANNPVDITVDEAVDQFEQNVQANADGISRLEG